MQENNEKKQELNYDFNFENQVKEETKVETPVAPAPATPEIASTEANPDSKADPSIGKVNPNPVAPVNVVPVDVQSAAGMSGGLNAKPAEEEKKEEVPNPEIKTSGTATEAEIEIDASKSEVEVLDEYEIKKDIDDSNKKFKRNWIFIGIFFAILFIAIFFFRYIIKIIGY